jgi:hypothetical protein
MCARVSSYCVRELHDQRIAPVFAESNVRDNVRVRGGDAELHQNEQCTEYLDQPAVTIVQGEY